MPGLSNRVVRTAAAVLKHSEKKRYRGETTARRQTGTMPLPCVLSLFCSIFCSLSLKGLHHEPPSCFRHCPRRCRPVRWSGPGPGRCPQDPRSGARRAAASPAQRRHRRQRRDRPDRPRHVPGPLPPARCRGRRRASAARARARPASTPRCTPTSPTSTSTTCTRTR